MSLSIGAMACAMPPDSWDPRWLAVHGSGVGCRACMVLHPGGCCALTRSVRAQREPVLRGYAGIAPLDQGGHAAWSPTPVAIRTVFCETAARSNVAAVMINSTICSRWLRNNVE